MKLAGDQATKFAATLAEIRDSGNQGTGTDAQFAAAARQLREYEKAIRSTAIAEKDQASGRGSNAKAISGTGITRHGFNLVGNEAKAAGAILARLRGSGLEFRIRLADRNKPSNHCDLWAGGKGVVSRSSPDAANAGACRTA